MRALDGATAALVLVAAGLYGADEPTLERRMRAALEAGAEPGWLDELVLAAVLFVGFPRALVLAAALRRIVPKPADAGDAADYEAWRAWARRGAVTCQTIYGANYQKLRENVTKLHPVLDPWIVVDGYGRILSRPALDPERRELCAIAMLIPQAVPRQLHSHLRGALNVGVRPGQVDAVLDLLERGSGIAREHVRTARAMWLEIGVRNARNSGSTRAPRSPHRRPGS